MTVENFFNKHGGYTREEMLERAIEFAKLHVEAALRAVNENAEVRVTENALIEEGSCYTTYDDGVISVTCDEYSILSAYSLNNIK